MLDPVNQPFTEDIVYPTEGQPSRAPQPLPKAARIEAYDRQKERERAQVREVLSTDAGEAFVFRILSQCGVYRNAETFDHAHMAYANGKRAIGLWLLDQLLQVSPELYPQLLVNHAKRQERLRKSEEAAEEIARQQMHNMHQDV